MPCSSETARMCLRATDRLRFIRHAAPLCSLAVAVAVAVNLRPTVSRPVCPGVRRPSGTCGQFFFLLEISFRQLRVCNFVAPSLTRGRVCNLLYNCFWALPVQSILGRSPAELTAMELRYVTTRSTHVTASGTAHSIAGIHSAGGGGELDLFGDVSRTDRPVRFCFFTRDRKRHEAGKCHNENLTKPSGCRSALGDSDHGVWGDEVNSLVPIGQEAGSRRN
jgi:hypothetical protein